MHELVVVNREQKAVTTSLKVAEYFGKEHKDVIRSIRNLECSPEFRRRNFALSSYVNRQGRSMPFYEMNRDGFMFVVMGFTGSLAARIKEAFIEAFNMMEERLRNPLLALPDSEKVKLLAQGVIELKAKVDELTPKAEAHDRAMDLGDSMTMTNAAKMMGIGSRSIGPMLAHPRLHPGDPLDSWVSD